MILNAVLKKVQDQTFFSLVFVGKEEDSTSIATFSDKALGKFFGHSHLGLQNIFLKDFRRQEKFYETKHISLKRTFESSLFQQSIQILRLE